MNDGASISKLACHRMLALATLLAGLLLSTMLAALAGMLGLLAGLLLLTTLLTTLLAAALARVILLLLITHDRLLEGPCPSQQRAEAPRRSAEDSSAAGLKSA